LHWLNDEQRVFLPSHNLVAGGEAYRANYVRAHFTDTADQIVPTVQTRGLSAIALRIGD